MNIYVASSWRNPWQPSVVALLRSLGHGAYDYRSPEPGDHGFSWSEIDPEWQRWAPERYRRALSEPPAVRGFALDMGALRACDACVLVLPCGSSAHLELGWAIGAGKRTAVLFPHGIEPVGIRGHTVSREPCAACGDLGGCHLPARLYRVEPELMAKAADAILINRNELVWWVS